MVPIGRGEGELQLAVLVRRRDALEVLELLDVRALAAVADFASADDGFARDFFRFEEGGLAMMLVKLSC